MIDLKKAKTADLEAELALYTEAGIENVPAADTLKNNKDRVAAIEALQKEHGFPVKLDAEFVQENATLAKVLMDQGAAEGSIVFAEAADLETSQKLDLEASRRDEIVKELAGLGNIFESQEQIAQLSTEHLEESLAKAKAAAEKGTGNATPSPVVAHQQDAGAPREQVYRRDGHGPSITVVRVTDVVLQGKSYKEILISTGESYRLTPEEFTNDVTYRD